MTRSMPRGALAIAVAILSAPLLVAIPSAQAEPREQAAAEANQGCQTVHAGPQIPADQAHSSYFQLSVRPGTGRDEAVLLANPEPYACSVTLEAAAGQTAMNTGDTYPVTTGRCEETSCWITGLPKTISVPAHGRVTVPFRVAVPVGASSGEYLAGVVARPTQPATPATKGAPVAIAVASRVAIGVAVTVPGPLRPLLAIPTVTLDAAGGAAHLTVHVSDRGNTWEHPTGGAVIRVEGQDRRLGVQASTILPGDSARLPLATDGVAQGSWPTEVVLYYGPGYRLKATWRGRITYPAPARSGSGVAPITASRGQDAAHPRSASAAGQTLPTWIYAVIGALVVMVALLLLFLVLLYRKRHGEEDDAHRPPAVHDDRPPDRVEFPVHAPVR